MLSLSRLRILRDLIANVDDEPPHPPFPKDSALARGLQRAEELASNYTDPVVDAAALYFAFSEDDSIAVDHETPLTFALEQLEELGCAMSEADAQALLDYRDMIAEGFPWEEFVAWFDARVIRAPRMQ